MVISLNIGFFSFQSSTDNSELNHSNESISISSIDFLEKNINSSVSNASFIGEEANDNSGYSISGVGDVNGDGYGDFIIGANDNDDGGSDSGKVYLFFGQEFGLSNNIACSDANASFIGENPRDLCGRSVAGVGDVNKDGYADFLIGASNFSDGLEGRGKSYLFFGRVSGWHKNSKVTDADASFLGDGLADYSGRIVSGAGDVNGDGYDDILIGAYNYEITSGIGITYLILGKDRGWEADLSLSNADASYIGENDDDESGIALSRAGDVNGDGYDDFLIGAHRNDDGGSNSGKSYLIFGKKSGWHQYTNLNGAGASFIGESANDRFGYTVSGAGDINGDGYDDFLIGAWLNDFSGVDGGKAYLFFGKETGWERNLNSSKAAASYFGEEDGQWFGISVSGAGDINADGYSDFLIGAENNDFGATGAGKAYLFFGKEIGWERNLNASGANASIFGESFGDQLGHSVSEAGDINGDGGSDFLIGAIENDDGGNNAGKTYLFFGEVKNDPPVNDDGNNYINNIPGYNLVVIITIFGISVVLIAKSKFRK
ncbi:MAG: hypothetical protein BAJALOKI3v1_130014 [Promethearchaeota archaeon]|nr:MAG: hypothetical protein BAJALOKI3v1_130014 [Candidatus Lokiarchaeota archaeon]